MTLPNVMAMKKSIISLCAIIIFPVWLMAQGVGIQTNTPHPNASLDIRGVNKGLLIPRGDNASRVALNSNNAKGLLMYDTISNTLWMHNGNGLSSGWKSLSTGVNYWSLSGALGTEICNSNSGGFWSPNPTTVLSDPGFIEPPVSGSGTRMMWMPSKGAFRSGTVESNRWDASNIGPWSFATGFNNMASGDASIAMGYRSVADEFVSFAFGYGATASGHAAISLGDSTLASGPFSAAMGYHSKALGEGSFATGIDCISSGNSTFAAGYISTASGTHSTAIGNRNNAYGYSSTALGHYSIAKGFASTVIGMLNDSILHTNQGIATDSTPLFIIGNGFSTTNRANALVVWKTGKTEINGYARLGKITEGSPVIKMKKLTGTSASSQNAWVNVAHGLTQSKIISVNIIMTVPGFVNVPPSYTFHAGYEYEYQVAASNIVVINTATNSANILSKAFTVLIVYEE